MYSEQEKLHYDDICIVPEKVTTINSRSQCIPFKSDNLKLPIFTAPMSSVVNLDNWMEFESNKINTILPRSEDINERLSHVEETNYFSAFSLKEIKNYFLSDTHKEFIKENFGKMHVCIDIANGHMFDMIDVIRQLREYYGNQIVIMAGNIANPETYKLYEEVGCDYIRINIGSGSACTTSANVAVHYPIFSLLKEVYDIKKNMNGKCKIIADGGIKNYDHIQKALIYADYVMIGGLFNQMIESAADIKIGNFYFYFNGVRIFNPLKTLLYKGKKINMRDVYNTYPRKRSFYKKIYDDFINNRVELYKDFYGMSTKIAQKEMGNERLKTSEGLIKEQKIKYTLKGWVENEIDYLRSAMSYTNSLNLESYKESKWVIMSGRHYNK